MLPCRDGSFEPHTDFLWIFKEIFRIIITIIANCRLTMMNHKRILLHLHEFTLNELRPNSIE